MDQDLTTLARALQANPGDEATARRYEAALRRAGRTDEVDSLYRLTFACPLGWSDLSGGSFDEVRHCAECSRDVYYVQTRREMARWVAEGACVALDPDTIQETFRVLVDTDRTAAVDRPGRPCVIEMAPSDRPASLRGVRGRIKAPRRPPSPEPEVSREAREILETLGD